MRSAGVVMVMVALTVAVDAQTGSWTSWRGSSRDGSAPFTPPKAWPQQLAKRWEVTVGTGHSSPVVSGDRVIVHTRQGEREIVRAIDLTTGKQLWQDAYDAPYRINPAAQAHGPGPKSTPAIGAGAVFTFGISGILSALDLISGKVLWRTPAAQTPPEFGTAMSPIVVGASVIAHMGGQSGGALTSFDAKTGQVQWRWNGDGPAYASPVLATFGGVPQLITQTQNSVVGVSPADGKLLWQLPLKTPYEQNSVTPVVWRDLLIYSGLENGTTAVRLVREGQSWKPQQAWKSDEVSMYMSTPVAIGNALFGLSHRNRGQFFALDTATGKTLWRSKGREGENASFIRAGELLLVSTTNSEVIVANASAAGMQELKRYTVAESAVWAHPAVVGSTILVKDVDKLIAWSF